MVGYRKSVPIMPMASPYVKVGADLGLRHELFKTVSFFNVVDATLIREVQKQLKTKHCAVLKKERKEKQRRRRHVIKAATVFTLSSLQSVLTRRTDSSS